MAGRSCNSNACFQADRFKALLHLRAMVRTGTGAPMHTHKVEEVLSVISGKVEGWLGHEIDLDPK